MRLCWLIAIIAAFLTLSVEVKGADSTARDRASPFSRQTQPVRLAAARQAQDEGQPQGNAQSPEGNAEPGEPTEVEEEAEAPAPTAPALSPAASAYKGVYYDNDFSYLRNPDNREFYLGDYFKQRRVGRRSLLDLGGEYRLRDHHEHGIRGSALNGLNDDFLLQRTRFYGNLEVGEGLRFFGEALDSATSFQRHLPRTTEINGIEALNLFVDARLLDGDRGDLWGRVGRQELLLGNQRLIGPAEWNNILRTFDGAKLFWRGEKWDVDAFWVRPVAFGNLPAAQLRADQPDLRQELTGVYSTYRGVKDQTFDYYYFGQTVYGPPQTPANPVDQQLNTFGSRWQGKRGKWLWEFEGGYQFGRYAAKSDSAGFAVAGAGRELPDAPWKPTVWTFYDWASGTANPNGPSHHTFNQLYPWAHRYMGWMDLVARQNIRDLNIQSTFVPSEKTRLVVWYHIFHLDQARDALYNAAGAPIRISPTGSAGRYVGQELDLLFQVIVNPRADVLFGYSHFFPGSYIKATNPAGVSGQADFYYSQWSWRF